MAASKPTNQTWILDTGKKTVTGGNGIDIIDLSNNAAVNSNGWKIGGGNGADVITGSKYNDVIWGDGFDGVDSKDNGADTLRGGDGNDEIHGGNGADIISGDAGADNLYGDRGGDIFQYRYVTDSTQAATDTIHDFKASEGDKLDFSLLNANGQITGTGHPDMLTWSTGPGAYKVWSTPTQVFADTNGDGVADMVINVTGVTGSDFIGVNHDPLARNDTAAVNEDANVSGNLRTNDSDSDGDALSYTLVSAVPGLTVNADGTWSFDASVVAYQHLAAGATALVVANVTVTDGHGGSATQTLSITVTGTDDAPVFSGSFAGEATEAGRGDGEGAAVTPGATASGDANYSDVDDGSAQDLWNASSGSATYGSFSVDAAGVWTYTPDNANSLVEALQEGEQLTDTFKITTADGTPKTITVTLNGANDAPTTVDDTTGTTENSVVSIDVVANDVDVDNANIELRVGRANTLNGGTVNTPGGTANGLTLEADGRTLTFNPNNYVDPITGVHGFDYLAAGETAQVRIDYNITDPQGANSNSVDSPPWGSLYVTITGTDDLAVIQAGGNTGSVTEDAADSTVSGDLDSTDVDGTPDSWNAATIGGSGHYGTLTFGADGKWEYALDNANSDVNALNTGEHLIDTFTVQTADGQNATITVTINGHTDVSPLPAPLAPTTTGDPNDFDPQGNASGTTITGNNGTETLYGGAGDDKINGNNGNDLIYGGSGNDTLNGNNDNDTIYGGSGSDTIDGSNGNDKLIGGWGADVLTGGAGSDAFKFLSANDRGDVITDFSTAQGDKIDLAALGVTHFSSTGADAHAVWLYGAGSTTIDGSAYSGNIYAADTDGDAGTIEFWFVVKDNPTPVVLHGGDFLLSL